MSTTTPTKVLQTALLAWQDIASGAVAISSAYDVRTVFAASFGIRLGRRSGTAFTVGPIVRIEAGTSSTGPWTPIWSYQMQVGASIANTVVQATLNTGGTTLTPGSSTNIATGDLLFLRAASTANYEIVRAKTVSAGPSITLEEGTLTTHAISDLLTDQAEMVCPSIDLSAYNYVRAVVENYQGGQDMACEVLMTTLNSLTTA